MLIETSYPFPWGGALQGGALADSFGSMALDLLRSRSAQGPASRRKPRTSPTRPDVAWLHVLPDELHPVVRDAITILSLAEGETLLARGEPLAGWYGVISGFLGIERDGAPALMAGSGVVQRAWFGEDYLLDDRPCDCTLVARAPSKIMVLAAATFTELLRDPGFCRVVLRVQAQRLQALRERLAWAARMGVNTRVALIIAGLFPDECMFEGEYVVGLTQAALARFVGLSRQRTNEALQQLQRLGEVELAYGGLRVRNPRQLVQRAFAGDLA